MPAIAGIDIRQNHSHEAGACAAGTVLGGNARYGAIGLSLAARPTSGATHAMSAASSSTQSARSLVSSGDGDNHRDKDEADGIEPVIERTHALDVHAGR